MRIKHKANVIAAVDANLKDKLFALDDTLSEVTLDGFKEASHGQVVLAAAAVFSIPFAAIASARGIFLKGSGDFALALNGGADLSVRRGVVGPASTNLATSAKVFLEALLTSAQVTNGAAEITLQYCVWGDPVV